MEQLLNHMRNLGFTEMEAKVMIDLSGAGPSSGYEVAKRLGVSRSNVYATLQRLSQQGFLHSSEGEPIRYSMLRVSELTRILSGQMLESLSYIENVMPRTEAEKPAVDHVAGDDEVVRVLAHAIQTAAHEVVIDACRDEVAMMRSALEAAESRGIKLLWSCDTEDHGVGMPMGWPSWSSGRQPQHTGRKFSFVIDRRWSMLGIRGEGCSTSAMVTEHPAMVRMLLDYFSHEMVLFEIEQDLGEKLIERYGPRYESIVHKYVGSEYTEEDQTKRTDEEAAHSDSSKEE